MSRPLSSRGQPSVTPAVPRSVDTRLHGRYLLLARMAWVAIAVLTVVCIALSIPVEFTQLKTVCTTSTCEPSALSPANVRQLGTMGLSVGFFAAYQVAVDLIFAATSFAVGVLVFWRKSDEHTSRSGRISLPSSFSSPTLHDWLEGQAGDYPGFRRGPVFENRACFWV